MRRVGKGAPRRAHLGSVLQMVGTLALCPPADSDEDAQAFRFDGALDSDMMSPRAGASLAW